VLVNTVNIVDFVAVTAFLTTIYGDDIIAVAAVRAIKIILTDIDVSLRKSYILFLYAERITRLSRVTPRPIRNE